MPLLWVIEHFDGIADGAVITESFIVDWYI